MKKEKNYIISSGNVFADLGVVDPEKKLAKAELAHQINVLIQEKNLTQEKAAELLGVDQSKISLLGRGKLSGFSLERLFRFLNALDQKVTITIAPKRRSRTKNNDVVVNLRKVKSIPVVQQKITPHSRIVRASRKKK